MGIAKWVERTWDCCWGPGRGEEGRDRERGPGRRVGVVAGTCAAAMREVRPGPPPESRAPGRPRRGSERRCGSLRAVRLLDRPRGRPTAEVAAGVQGKLHSDAYAGYDALHRENGGLADAVACLAHARRNFRESRDLRPNGSTSRRRRRQRRRPAPAAPDELARGASRQARAARALSDVAVMRVVGTSIRGR